MSIYSQIKGLCDSGDLKIFYQPSIPRCGTNIITRVIEQSPDVDISVNSLIRDAHYDQDDIWRVVLDNFERAKKDTGRPCTMYIKENSFFIGPKQWEQIKEVSAGIVFVIRDPIMHATSELDTLAKDTSLLKNRLIRQGVASDEGSALSYLESYANGKGFESGSLTAWGTMREAIKKTQDWKLYDEIFDQLYPAGSHELPEDRDDLTGKEYSNRNIFFRSLVSWRRSAELLRDCADTNAIVIDATIFQGCPQSRLDVFEKLDITIPTGVEEGELKENKMSFGAEKRAASAWTAKAFESTRILPPAKIPATLSSLPGVSDVTIVEKLSLFKEMMADARRVGPNCAHDVAAFFMSDVGGEVSLIDRNPTTCFVLAENAGSEGTVEQVRGRHPDHLDVFYVLARESELEVPQQAAKNTRRLANV